MILLSCATAMSVLRVMSRVSALFSTKQGIIALGQCSRECWQTLRDGVVVLRLLSRAGVKHAAHLVPEEFVSVETQMHLAVVNSRFYARALMRWRTQTLDGLDLAQLKARYREFFDIDEARRMSMCAFCHGSVINFFDRADKNIFRSSRVCLSCRATLQNFFRGFQQRWDMPNLRGHLWDLGRDWVRLCQVRYCIRFQDPYAYDLAVRVARHRMSLENYAWHLAQSHVA